MAESQTVQPQRSLAAIPLLAGLSPAGLKDIEQRCSWRRYEPGEPIVEYLDRSDDVFCLVDGEARVIIYSLTGKVVSFHDLTPGDMFGEYPSIDGRPRSASVEARTSCLRLDAGRCVSRPRAKRAQGLAGAAQAARGDYPQAVDPGLRVQR